MGSFVRTALAALFGISATCASASGIWFSSGDSLYRLDPGSNQALLIAAPGSTSALAVDPKDGSAWVVLGNRAIRLSESGSLIAEIDLKSLGLQNPSGFSLNPFSSSLWVADGKTLAQFDAAGRLLSMAQVPGVVRPLSLGVDQHIWILGNKELWRYSPQAALVAGQTLNSLLEETTKHLAVDSLGGTIWVGGEKQIVQLDLSNPALRNFSLAAEQTIIDTALDSRRGALWVLTKSGLVGISRDGTITNSATLDALGISKPGALAYDAATDSLWLGHAAGLAQFSAAADLLRNVATAEAVSAVGVPPSLPVPTVSILGPPQNGLTNNPRPEFRLAYDALCSGASCGFPPSYFSNYSLSALLNNQPVGSLFAFEASTRQTSFTPSQRLPEGGNSFSAEVRDQFGNSSAPTAVEFTVDTVAPRFLTLGPADGSVFQLPQAVIQGTIDDPTAGVGLTNHDVSQSGAGFSFPVVLQPGMNTFVLSAIDLAGNVATATLRLTLSAISVAITSPTSGATINSDRVAVSGTFQGPANTGITVNGVVAAITGNTFVASNIALQPGVNTLVAIATGPEGQTETQTISVTSSGPAPIGIVASSVQGMAPWDVSFSIVASTGIARIEVDYNGDGTVDFTTTNPKAVLRHTYAAPGTYQARFNVTDSQGMTHALTQIIVVVSVASMDSMLRGTYSAMLTKLRAGDIEGALVAFTASANEKFRPAFTVLRPSLASVVDQLGAIQDGTISNGFAEYTIVRNLPDGPQAFLLYFVRGKDGVWRIDTM